MNKQLKPCPFCGGVASAEGHVRFHRGTPNSWWKDGTPVEEAYFCNCLNCGISNRNIIGGHQTQAKAISAWNTRALPAAPAVKGLKWESDHERYFEAKSIIGIYNAIKSPAVDYWLLAPPMGDRSRHDTLEAAKAAAQSDYEARILAALE